MLVIINLIKKVIAIILIIVTFLILYFLVFPIILLTNLNKETKKVKIIIFETLNFFSWLLNT